MKISKTSLKFAEKRDFEIQINDENEIKEVRILTKNEEKNFFVKFENNDRGLFFMKSNLDQQIKEELHYWIETEKQFREVIQYIRKEINIENFLKNPC